MSRRDKRGQTFVQGSAKQDAHFVTQVDLNRPNAEFQGVHEAWAVHCVVRVAELACGSSCASATCRRDSPARGSVDAARPASACCQGPTGVR